MPAEVSAAFAADRALIAAMAARDADALSPLLDQGFVFVDVNGRMRNAQEFARDPPPSPLGDEGGAKMQLRGYGEVVAATVERDKIFILRIWVKRDGQWRALAWHEVSQLAAPPQHGPGCKDWDNPSRTIPYAPRNDDERDCLAAWQRLETAVMQHEAEIWAKHVVDEFLVVGATRRHGKADRKAVIEEQKRTDADSAPAPLASARMYGFANAMVMLCEHQPFHGKAAQVSRVFVKRDGQWLMAVSFQTTRQDALVKKIKLAK
jgi:hypothetical protein